MGAMKKRPRGCAGCGSTELIDAVDNDGKPYKGCPKCRFKTQAEIDAMLAPSRFRVDLASALALAERLADRPTAEDAQRGADCIKSMIRELNALRTEG